MSQFPVKQIAVLGAGVKGAQIAATCWTEMSSWRTRTSCCVLPSTSGGDVGVGSLVSEEYLMTLERQAFCSLLTHPKTQERIMRMMSTGKPVRN